MLQAYVSSSFQNLSSNLGRILALHAYSLSKTYVLAPNSCRIFCNRVSTPVFQRNPLLRYVPMALYSMGTRSLFWSAARRICSVSAADPDEHDGQPTVQNLPQDPHIRAPWYLSPSTRPPRPGAST